MLLLGTLGLAGGGKTTLTIQKPEEWWSPSRNASSSTELKCPADPIFSFGQLWRSGRSSVCALQLEAEAEAGQPGRKHARSHQRKPCVYHLWSKSASTRSGLLSAAGTTFNSLKVCAKSVWSEWHAGANKTCTVRVHRPIDPSHVCLFTPQKANDWQRLFFNENVLIFFQIKIIKASKTKCDVCKVKLKWTYPTSLHRPALNGCTERFPKRL